MNWLLIPARECTAQRSHAHHGILREHTRGLRRYRSIGSIVLHQSLNLLKPDVHSHHDIVATVYGMEDYLHCERHYCAYQRR